ncbi:hypothetical protein OKW20_000003 [Ensifer sp. LBL]
MRKQPALSVFEYRYLLYNALMMDGRTILWSMTAAVAFLFAAEATLAAPPDHGCTCRNRDGSKYELGQVACLRVDGSAYLARCEMNLNVTTWKKLREGCPTAGMSTPSRPALQSVGL